MKPRGVTRIGWLGLGLSILSVAMLVPAAMGFAFGLSGSAYTDPLNPENLLGLFVIFAPSTGVVAIVFDVLAGKCGLGNRIAGIVGGLIMLAPGVYVLIVSLQP